jgi:hypothetical protein
VVDVDDAISTRSILSILFHSDPRLARAIDPALTAQISTESVFTLQRVSQQMHEWTPKVAAMAAAASTKPACVVAVRHWVSDFVDGFAQSSDPVHQILGLLATQYLLGKAMEAARELPAPVRGDLVAAIGRAVFDGESGAPRDSFFFTLTVFHVVHTAAPEAASAVFRGLVERGNGGVSLCFGLLRAVVRQYEMSFAQGARPLDAFIDYATAIAGGRVEVRPALDWAKERLQRWTDDDAA